ncbi:MAG TPA: redoxin domain-containing protein [Chloroflexia bacterium]|nr:redoxin domain-containing protein [Chloroflexia bacterium]
MRADTDTARLPDGAAPDDLTVDDFADASAADTDLLSEYEEPAPARSSLLPLVLSSVGGLIVIGLLGAVMLTGRGGNPPVVAGGTDASGMCIANAGPGEKLAVGSLAPNFALRDLAGNCVTLSSYRGVQPVWVNFWATWCPPCKAEMPEMETLYPQYKAKGVEILGVDVQEDKGLVTTFIKNNKYSWRFLLDSAANTSRKYQVSGIPTHVFVGRDGVIKSIVISGLNRDRMVAELEKMTAP